MSEKKPKNPVDEKGRSRVIRGGYWSYDPDDLRSSDRSNGSRSYRDYSTGFRIARTAKK